VIRTATQSDAPRIAEIYNYFIRETIVTFEETEINAAEMWTRIASAQKEHYWIVFEYEGVIAGYAYAGNWKSRCAYRQSLETTIYLDVDYSGRGFGKILYADLINKLRADGAHAIMGGVALPNEASVALHESLGYQKVAHFKEVGYKMGRWIDVAYWELILD
jgi:phosphinothricin acetyltransferase